MTSTNIDRIIAEIGVSVVEVRDLKALTGENLALRMEAYRLLREAQGKLRLIHDAYRLAGD